MKKLRFHLSGVVGGLEDEGKGSLQLLAHQLNQLAEEDVAVLRLPVDVQDQLGDDLGVRLGLKDVALFAEKHLGLQLMS